jgi:hypothetical protein
LTNSSSRDGSLSPEHVPAHNPKNDHECLDPLVVERPLPTIRGGRGLFVSLVAGAVASLSADLKSGKLLTKGLLTGSTTPPMIQE